jgi:hypothetical protein
MLGYSEVDWIGQHACMIFTPADKAIEVCESEMQIARERGCATDIRWHRHKDGTDFFENGFMNALHDEQGRLIGYAKIMSDDCAVPRRSYLGGICTRRRNNVRGEILQLKEATNTMVDQLRSFASEVTRVAREVEQKPR